MRHLRQQEGFWEVVDCQAEDCPPHVGSDRGQSFAVQVLEYEDGRVVMVPIPWWFLNPPGLFQPPVAGWP